MNTVTVTLTSYNMGDNATEADFDRWIAFVDERLGTLVNFDVTVEADRFGTAGDDRFSGADEEQRETLRTLLGVDLWNEWCAAGAPGASDDMVSA
jgi:hypothetical protein